MKKNTPLGIFSYNDTEVLHNKCAGGIVNRAKGLERTTKKTEVDTVHSSVSEHTKEH